jgi:hypothetical protein
MKTSLFFWIPTFLLTVAILFLESGGNVSAEGDRCADILRDGVFNKTILSQSNSLQQAFDNWTCAMDFGTHDDARSAGVDLGVEVYGVPIKLGGTWNSGTKDTWKKAHCSQQTGSTSKSTALYLAVSKASPEILAAWSRCMESKRSDSAVGCNMIQKNDTVVFKSWWNKSIGDKQQPTVKFFGVYNAKCLRNWKKGDKLPEGEAGAASFVCTPSPESDAVIILETDRGSCTPVGELVDADSYVVPAMKLDKPTTISNDHIIFNAESKIVTNGYDLQINARHIIFQGSPSIVSYETPAAAGAGAFGNSGGQILIQADRLSGSALIIDNFGQNGAQGSTGGTGGKGSKGVTGSQRSWQITTGCGAGSNGGQGGQGSRGGDGGSGGRGGDGGAVVYRIGNGLNQGVFSRLNVVQTHRDPSTGMMIPCNGTCGGVGGPGGAPGGGGAGGDGGDGASGTDKCGNTNPGPTGPVGPSGGTGPAGANGSKGTITNVPTRPRS